MLDGSTAGRAFESPIAPYLFGALAVISIALWLWGRYEIRKYHDASETEKDREP